MKSGYMRSIIFLLLLSIYSVVAQRNVWVDPLSGSDANSGLSENSPIATFSYLTSSVLQDKDTVFLKGRVYEEVFSLNYFTVNNGWDSGVNITNAPGETVVLTTPDSTQKILDIGYSNYIRFSGITFLQPKYDTPGVDALINIVASDHLIFDNCTFKGGYEDGSHAILLNSAHKIIIQNCVFDNWKAFNIWCQNGAAELLIENNQFLDTNSSATNDLPMVYLDTPDSSVVRWNKFSAINSACLEMQDLSSVVPTGSDWNVVEGNTMTSTNGLCIKGPGGHTIYRNNYLLNCYDSGIYYSYNSLGQGYGVATYGNMVVNMTEAGGSYVSNAFIMYNYDNQYLSAHQMILNNVLYGYSGAGIQFELNGGDYDPTSATANTNLYSNWTIAGNCIYPDAVNYLESGSYTVEGLQLDSTSSSFFHDNVAEIPQFADTSDPICGLSPGSSCAETIVPLAFTSTSATDATSIYVSTSIPFFAGNEFVEGDHIQIGTNTFATISGKEDGVLFVDKPIDYESQDPVTVVVRKNPACFPSESPSGDSKTKDKMTLIGIIIGAAVLVVAAAFIIVAVIIRRRKNDRTTHSQPQAPTSAYEDASAISMQPVTANTSNNHSTIHSTQPISSSKHSSTIHENVIPEKDIQLLEPVGEGRFGAVYKGLFNKTSLVALKTLKIEAKGSNFSREADLLSRLRHPNIVQFHGIWLSPKKEEFMVFEFVNRGSLGDLLPQLEGKSDTSAFLKMAVQVASGMNYLESMNIVHRDLAARNILVKEDDYGYILKISDFGLSRELNANQYYTSKDNEIPVKWTSPEALAYNKYSSKSDVWSFGIVVWEMFEFGKVPYPKFTNAVTREKVMEGYRLEKPPACPDNVYKLLLQCWEEKPQNRPSFADIQQTLSSWIETKDRVQVPTLVRSGTSSYYNKV